jgi:hypothetical protein
LRESKAPLHACRTSGRTKSKIPLAVTCPDTSRRRREERRTKELPQAGERGKGFSSPLGERIVQTGEKGNRCSDTWVTLLYAMMAGGSQLCCEIVGSSNQASWPGAPRLRRARSSPLATPLVVSSEPLVVGVEPFMLSFQAFTVSFEPF